MSHSLLQKQEQNVKVARELDADVCINHFQVITKPMPKDIIQDNTLKHSFYFSCNRENSENEVTRGENYSKLTPKLYNTSNKAQNSPCALASEDSLFAQLFSPTSSTSTRQTLSSRLKVSLQYHYVFPLSY